MFVSTVHFPCLYSAQIVCMKMESPFVLMVSSDMLMYWQLYPFVTYCTGSYIPLSHTVLGSNTMPKDKRVMLLFYVTIHCGLISMKIGYLCLGNNLMHLFNFLKLSLQQKYWHTKKCVFYACVQLFFNLCCATTYVQ
jgi:hypothetical protein